MTTTVSPTYGHAPFPLQGGVGADPGYDAIDVRRALSAMYREGVLSETGWKVTERGAGANMSVDIASASEGAYVEGDAVTEQGLYYVAPHSGVINEAISAANPGSPRIDRVILEVQDNAVDGSGGNLARVRVLAGTPTSGATLDNQSGAATVPGGALKLAEVLVAAGATSIANAAIRDHRPYARRSAEVGQIASFGTATAPAGWKACQGGTLKRLAHARLFAVIGTAYGAGDGSTTFGLPDLRGRTLVGVDGAAGRLSANDALGNGGGEEAHTLTQGELAAHTHTGPSHIHDSHADGSAVVINVAQGGATGIYGLVLTEPGSDFVTGPGGTGATGSAGSGTPHNNLQPYQVCEYHIFTGSVAA